MDGISFKEWNPFRLRRSVGVGVRFFLPMFGLLGFDYGIGLDRITPNGQIEGMPAALHSCLDLNRNKQYTRSTSPIHKYFSHEKNHRIGFVLVFFVLTAAAQRYAVIDTKYILDKMPEYKEAQKKLDQFSEQWQREIEARQSELDMMYRNYEAEQVMLSEELRKKTGR